MGSIDKKPMRLGSGEPFKSNLIKCIIIEVILIGIAVLAISIKT